LTRPAEIEHLREHESGQAAILLLVILSVFLLGVVGFAVDLSNMWFQRQAAQSAADAACMAGAMDMLYVHNGSLASTPGFTPGTNGDCYTVSSSALCQYAAFNAYTASASSSGWNGSTPAGAIGVNWNFPASRFHLSRSR
jgi:uncharacterized membrane protein